MEEIALNEAGWFRHENRLLVEILRLEESGRVFCLYEKPKAGFGVAVGSGGPFWFSSSLDEDSFRKAARDLLAISRAKAFEKLMEIGLSLEAEGVLAENAGVEMAIEIQTDHVSVRLIRSAQRSEQGKAVRYRVEVDPLGLVLQDTELIPLAHALARAVGSPSEGEIISALRP